jgi:hypothetical protein
MFEHYGLDLDGVVLSFTDAVRLEVGRPEAPDPLTFNNWGWNMPCGREPFRIPGVADRALFNTDRQPERWLTKYAHGILSFLSDKTVTIITARPAQACLNTAAYVASVIPDLRGVVCLAHGTGKSDAMVALGIDALFDDCLDNLVAAESAGLTGIQVPWSWNEEWAGPWWNSDKGRVEQSLTWTV